MRLVIGDVWIQNHDAAAIAISRAVSDPVPTCTLVVVDNTSTYVPQALQEVLVLDDKLIPSPTLNLITNPTLNTYNSNGWVAGSLPAGLTLSQNTGGGVIATLANTAVGTTPILSQSRTQRITPGVVYMLSAYVQGGSSPTNFRVNLVVEYQDVNGNLLATNTATGTTPPSTTLTRYTLQTTAPASAASTVVIIDIVATSGTNSGNVTITQVQFEPEWFSDIAYPTAFCGPGQTNCIEMDDFYPMYVRQYRRFAGIITKATASNYRGIARDWTITVSGYAWLLSAITANDSFTTQFDSAIITSLMNKYFAFGGGSGTFNLTNVIQGVQLSSFQLNWDDLRTALDNLVSQNGFYWTVDYYWKLLCQPAGWTTMPISLICDHSGTPDMVTTFPAYDFSVDYDFTQPGNAILVLGSGSNVSLVIDPNTSFANANYNIRWMQTNNVPFFMRKVNDSSLQSTTDTTNRGIAELLQYNNTRSLYRLTTNVELIPGENIAITSNTDNLNATSLLIQQISANWLGTDETLADTWEYHANLGPINRAAADMISRIFRRTNANTSAPAISNTVLVLFESLGIVDSAATASSATGYQATILADTPIAYYRLNNLEGTVVDDYSGNAFAGTTHASPTLGVTTLLTDAADAGDKAMTFAVASSQYISLPTTLIPTGSGHAWSIEGWCEVTSLPAATWSTIAAMGSRSLQQMGGIFINNNAGVHKFALSTFSGDIFSSGTVSTSTIYHVVGTYDGTSTRLYVNGSLVAGPTNFTVSLGTGFAQISSDNPTPADFFDGTIDEVAFYNYALSSTQVSAHHAAGI